MYEAFGFAVAPDGRQSLSLFVPDSAVDPAQYQRGGPSGIASVAVVGDWNGYAPQPMTERTHPNGRLFQLDFEPALPDGFYQYQYAVSFGGGSSVTVGDPCAKLAGDAQDRSAFVVGGSPVAVQPLAGRLPTSDLVIYELMIDDFTAGYRRGRPPVDAVVDRLDYLKTLGVNAVEFMPWIAWPDDEPFSWGYDPAYFFSVEHAYLDDPANPLERLSRLGRLVGECHRRGLHVLLDIVLQHARQGPGTRGFPYCWLWENPADSPFVGDFVPHADDYGMAGLDYDNACTQQFAADVCRYWLKRFQLDGFRFDEVSGFDNPRFPQKGAPEVVAELKEFAAAEGIANLSLIIEDAWDDSVIEHANQIQPTGAWWDWFRSAPFGAFSGSAITGRLDPWYMRVLNSALGFDARIAPTIYLENHDHASVAAALGSRERWYKAQPYMIALATCPGAVLIHNGQEWGQVADFWEDDGQAPPQFKRVQPRPLDWAQADDPVGRVLRERYRFLIGLRKAHPGLRSPDFYPDYYDPSWSHLSPDGYGIDVDRQLAIYHRWGGSADGQVERFLVVLNFGDADQSVDVPLPLNGRWLELLNGGSAVDVEGWWLRGYRVPSNWGCLFWRTDPA